MGRSQEFVKGTKQGVYIRMNKIHKNTTPQKVMQF